VKLTENAVWKEIIFTQSGTYLLIFQSLCSCSVPVGRLGILTLVPGFYFYVGSAFGSGGLVSRIQHHLNPSLCAHWHLDYVKTYLFPRKAFLSPGRKREHTWAGILQKDNRFLIPLKKFGSSDCHCPSHFFFSRLETVPRMITKESQEVKIGNLQAENLSWSGHSPSYFLLVCPFRDSG